MHLFSLNLIDSIYKYGVILMALYFALVQMQPRRVRMQCGAPLYAHLQKIKTNRGKVHRTQVHVRKSLGTFAWTPSLSLMPWVSSLRRL
jgi:hypothetical protein